MNQATDAQNQKKLLRTPEAQQLLYRLAIRRMVKMAHSSIEVTASFYAVFSQQELSRMHRRFGPLRHLKPKRDQMD